MTDTILNFRPEKAKSFLEEVMERSGQKLTACYQCRRCAAGCTVGDETSGVTPDRLIRMIMFGDRGDALNNKLVWKCVSCYTCGTRCPNEIQTARITETLKKMATEERTQPVVPEVKYFHDSFVNSGIRWGRVNEMEFMGSYELKNTLNKLKQKDVHSIVDEIKNQTKLALAMQKKKRMHFDFLKADGRSEIKRLRKKAKKSMV